MAAALGIYIHVPFCASRCGYCDFNTYVPGGDGPVERFGPAAGLELAMARAELGDRPVSTVFFGGGTPSLLGAEALVALLDDVRQRFGLRPDAEVTTEANPESVSPAFFAALADAGFTRVSLGMQSAAPHVLRTLDRVHSPGRAVAAAREARAAGIRHVSLDLIYGTPGETDADWEATLEAALSAEPDHISAYGLTVEPGTALAAAVRRRALPAPDEDAQARRFLIADRMLSAAGLHWYEISSWAADEAARCRHNIGYWNSADWWGVGPGAHSHVAGVRWWNVLRPAEYTARLTAGRSPAAGREVLSAEEQATERVMLQIRTRDGLAVDELGPAGREALGADSLRDRILVADGRVRLTPTGRLFASAVTHALTG
jgi:putative oxygen-independent coproporphyrinogen III oxidase